MVKERPCEVIHKRMRSKDIYTGEAMCAKMFISRESSFKASHRKRGWEIDKHFSLERGGGITPQMVSKIDI